MKALITGITGQTGSYLAELLLSKGYEVYGMVRRSSVINTERIDHIKNKINIVYGDLSDQASLDRILKEIRPDEVYNLAAQSFVPASWSNPTLTADITGLGVLRMLEAILKNSPRSKFYQASSSEMFGKVLETPQRETTPFYPRSPYGVAKVFGHDIVRNYRESYGLFACSGICFNHESPRRGLEFVTRKITNAVAKIAYNLQSDITLGNITSKRDWGFAGDYAEAMWLMLQQEYPVDYVISTGETHTVEEFCREAFDIVGLDYKQYIKTDSKFIRPAEVDILLGDSTKIQEQLNWKPKTSFQELVKMMVLSDLMKEGEKIGDNFWDVNN